MRAPARHRAGGGMSHPSSQGNGFSECITQAVESCVGGGGGRLINWVFGVGIWIGIEEVCVGQASEDPGGRVAGGE